MAGGTVYQTTAAEEICHRAHEHGIKVHLDGARVFNAATYLNEDVARMTAAFDSVQFCLSKGLGAPVGSMIVGTRELIERCRPIRKMLGGGMRQAGILAAAGLIALEQGPRRLQEDHDNAQVLAHRLAQAPGITLNAAKVQTNIVIFGLEKDRGDSAVFLKRLAEHDVLAVPVDARHVRMVTHLDVNRSDVEAAATAVAAVMQEL
jgi:threonine aldolase